MLVHSGDRILKELGEKVALFAQKKLVKRGMELRLNTRVKAVSSEEVVLSTDEVIAANTVICTTGNAPHKVISTLDFINSKGRLDTDEFFRVVIRNKDGDVLSTFDYLWGIGDCAFTPNLKKIKKDPAALCPPTAQFAVRMAPVLAKNIWATIKNKKLKPFAFKELGQMAVIGHLSGVAEVMGIRFSGFLAFFMWRAIYWAKLPGIYCKFRVMFDWLIHAFFPVDITQLDVYRTEKVDRSHYQKGSFVFKEGDIADYFYVIEEGQVEIIKENENEKDTVLAILNAGDSFGEMGLMQKAPRSASVRCLTPVGLLKISREDFKALTGSYSSLRDQLESRVSEIKQKNESTVGSVDEILKNIESKVESSNDAANSISEPVDEPKPEKQTESKPTETKQKPVVSTPDVHPVDKHVDPPPTFSELFKKGIEHENRDVLLTIEKDLERELYNQPTNTKLIKQYAELQNHLGFIENGLTLYYQYLSMVPNDVSVMARVGEMHRRLNQFDKCIHILEKAYPIEPQNISVISNLASSYRSKRQYKRAEDLLKKRYHLAQTIAISLCFLRNVLISKITQKKGKK